MIPAFVFSAARSGSTLLQRLLNTHSLAYIYGEHSGALGGLCKSIALLEHHAALSEKNGRMIRNKVDLESTWIAWARPFDQRDYIAALRDFITTLYKVDSLPPGSVWGFKEIRYDRRIAAHLVSIFPEGKLIILRRQFPEYFISCSKAFNRDVDASYSSFRDMARGYVENYEDLLSLQGDLGGERVTHVRYESLVQDAWATMAALFDWLGLPVDSALKDRVCRTAAVRVDFVKSSAEPTGIYLSEWMRKLDSEEPSLAARLQSLSAAGA